MNTFQAFILGLVQGVTEFLPISSSAHLVLVPWLFHWPDPGLAFDVFLHLGTFLALAIYFFRDWLNLMHAGVLSVVERRIGYQRDRILFWYIVWGTVPAAVAGLLLHEYVEAHFRAPLLMAVTLSSVGFLLYWVDGKYPPIRHLDEMTFRDAIWIGIAQACAIVPGVSRSGATMLMGRLLGMHREDAARFSFLLSMPIVLAANVFEMKDMLDLVNQGLSWGYLITGLVASTVFGLLSIHFLLGYLRSADFRVFAWYRMFIAIVILFCSIAFNW